MKIFFKKRKSLRDKCIEVYGEEFGEIYDALCMGVPVGGFCGNSDNTTND